MIKNNRKLGLSNATLRAKDMTKYTKAGKEYMKAKKDFYKTPLGKIQKFNNAISSGVKYIKKLFGKIFKKSDKHEAKTYITGIY